METYTTKNYPINGLIETVCEHFNIRTDEYYSNLRYGNISLSRQVVCAMLYRHGFRIKEIFNLTGFSEPRIVTSIKTFHSRYNDDILTKIETKMYEKGFITSTEEKS